MQIKAILFDIDGTLVDSNDMHVLAWEEAFAGIGEKFDRQVVHDQIGKGTDMLVPTLLPDLDEDASTALHHAHLAYLAELGRQGLLAANGPLLDQSDETIRRIRCSASNRPNPQPSTPQLFDTASSSSAPEARTASISTDGIPHNPKPPTASRDPLPMSTTASAALPTTLSTRALPPRCALDVTPAHPSDRRRRTAPTAIASTPHRPPSW